MATPEESPLPKMSEETLAAVGRKLKAKFAAYKAARRGVELQWMKNLRQVLGQYDADVLSFLSDNQSRAYPRITRVKVVSMVSRLMSLLFPTAEKNWSLSPSAAPSVTKETLEVALADWQKEFPDAELTIEAVRQAVAQYTRKAAGVMEREITDQLADIADSGAADYASLVRQVVHSAVTFSMGVIKGPMTIEYKSAEYTINEGVVEVQDVTKYRPYMQFVPIWDYYPDMSAKSFKQMEGQFQRHVFSRHQLKALADRPDFKKDAIEKYLRDHPDGNYTEDAIETQIRNHGIEGGTNNLGASRKYEVLEFWGYLGYDELMQCGVEIAESKKAQEVRATIWVVDEVIIKAQRDPFPDGVEMYHQFVFEEDDVNLCGSGLPPIMRDSQMAIANAARMLLDNAAAVCGPNVEVDIDLLMDGSDTTGIRPFKVWVKEGAGGSRAVNSISFDSHIGELVQVISTFQGIADAETFVGAMTGGDFENVSGDSLRTTGNMSMAMASAALPFKDIVRNFDKFTVDVIHSLVHWNLLFNRKPGMEGDMRPVARGATSLIAKEVRAIALDNLASTLTPEERVYVDTKALTKHRLSSRDLPLDELMVPDEVAEQRIAENAQAAQASQEQQTRAVEAEIAATEADTLKANSQAQRNLDVGETQTAQLILKALTEGISPDVITEYMVRGTPSTEPIAGDAGAGLDPGLPPASTGGDLPAVFEGT